MLRVFDAFAVVCDNDDDDNYSDDDDDDDLCYYCYYCGGGDGSSSKKDDETYLYITHTTCQLIMKCSYNDGDVYDEKFKLLCLARP